MLTIFCSKPFSISETFITRHIRELGSADKVSVLCFDDSYINDEGLKYLQIERRRLKYSNIWERIYLKIFKVYNLFFKGQTVFFSKSEYLRIAEFLKNNKCERILAEYGPLGCVIEPIARKLKIPFYVYFRGYDASALLRNRKMRISYKKKIPKAKAVFCVSQFLADNLNSVGIRNPNVYIIPSSVDLEQFYPSSKDPDLILATGRFTNKKGPMYSIKAFHTIVEKHPNVRLEMIGQGPLLESSKALVKELGMENRVIFHGAKNHEFVRQKMAKASIFIQHSITPEDGDTEGLPLAIQEALASGTVVVSTYHAGIPEAIMNGSNGYLVNEFDYIKMGEALEKIYSDDVLLKKMSIEARKTAEKKFSAKRNIKYLKDILFK